MAKKKPPHTIPDPVVRPNPAELISVDERDLILHMLWDLHMPGRFTWGKFRDLPEDEMKAAMRLGAVARGHVDVRLTLRTEAKKERLSSRDDHGRWIYKLSYLQYERIRNLVARRGPTKDIGFVDDPAAW